MAQEDYLQFTTAPTTYYSTTEQAEVEYVGRGNFNQGNDFSDYVNPNDYRKQQDDTPINGGEFAMLLLLVAFAVFKFWRNKAKKVFSATVILIVGGMLSINADPVARVWKYTFMDNTFTSATATPTMPLAGRTIGMSTGASCSFVDGLGMKIDKPASFQSNIVVDFFNNVGYDKVKSITIKINCPNTLTGSSVELRQYNTSSSLASHTIQQNDPTISLTVPNGGVAMPNGWTLHFTLSDFIYLRSIEVDYEDNSAGSNLPCHEFFANGELIHKFVQYDAGMSTDFSDNHLTSDNLGKSDWTYDSWCGNNDYRDADQRTTISSLGQAEATVYYATFCHERPNTVGSSDTVCRYYSNYEVFELYLVEGETFPNLTEDHTYPDGVSYTIKNMDNSRFYYFCLPFDCKVNQSVRFSNSNIKDYVGDADASGNYKDGDWVIASWNENGYYANLSTYGGWVDTEPDSLKLGRGYGVGIVPDTITDVTFHSAYNYTVTPNDSIAVEIDFSAPQSDNETGHRSGWNFLGNPRLVSVPLDRNYVNLNYVLEPCSTSNGWILHKLNESYMIPPLSAFMVQKQWKLIYTVNSSVTPVNPEDNFSLVMTSDNDNTNSDRSMIIASNSHTDDYEIGEDLAKMTVYEGTVQFFSYADSTQYAVNASSFGIGSKITFGAYVPYTGNWTISLDDNINIPEDWKLILTDKTTGTVLDITNNDLQLNIGRGLYQERFELEIVAAPTAIDVVENNNVAGEPTTLRIVTMTGIVMYEGDFNWNKLNDLPEGIYVLQTDLWTKKYQRIR